MPSAATASTGNEDGFLDSPIFYVIIAVVVAVPLGAFALILLILCCLCLFSGKVVCSWPKLDCTDLCKCPDIDCEDCCSCPSCDCNECCSDIFKTLCCGIKCDELNPIFICTIAVLGLLAAPVIIIVALPFLLCAGILYGLAHSCD